jgi:hypothetical protein
MFVPQGNSPYLSELNAMRPYILAIMISFSVCAIGDDRLERPSTTANLNDVVVEFVSAKHKFGPQHPNTVKLKRDLMARIDSGERLDLQQMDTKLSGYYRAYRAAKEKLSIRHPKTQESLRNLSIATKMLSYEPEFFSKNWEDLLAH